MAKLEQVSASVDEAIRYVRRTSADLWPPLLDHLGLVPAMEEHVKEFQERSGIGARLDLPAGRLPISREQRLALFRILQESLTNVARHARASEITVRLVTRETILILMIHDDGVGFSRSVKPGRSLGLLGMEERARLIGGCLSVYGAPRSGTTVVVELPLST
jgi:signal transduction histidine kinase